jgi:hypothetical protein
MRNTRWTKQEDEFLIESLKQTKNSRYKNYAAIAKILQRTEKAVKLRAQNYRDTLNEKQKQEVKQPIQNKNNRDTNWGEKQQNILLDYLSRINKFKNKTKLIEKVAIETGFSKTTVFDNIKKIEEEQSKQKQKINKKEQKTKSTFFQRLKELFFPKN